MSLSEDVKEWARQVGFDLVGIARAERLQDAEDATLERLRSGMLGGMTWFTESRVRLSCDPEALLPGARSVIVLGSSYLTADEGALRQGPLMGRIARYAWGADYHELMPPRMAALLALLGKSIGRQPAARCFVDSGPLAEKAVAAQAGIGWFGKNGCLLTPIGSWVLLAEIVTDLELEPDAPRRRDCGGCRLCADRCPTGAIVSPYVVDARRCISYLTIEHRGPIPRELRPQIGSWIFGCDVCQEVCPQNRDARPTVDHWLGSGREPTDALSLVSLMRLDQRGFKQLFRGSPILRAKRGGLLRNAAVALGNARDASAIPSLAEALRDPDPLVRSHAAWALGQIGGPKARAILEDAIAREADQAVRGEIVLAIEE